MQRAVLMVLIVALGVGLFLTAAHSQDDTEVLDNSWFDNPRRPAVAFPHDEHNEAAGLDDCSVCHHVYENGVKSDYDSSEDRACGDCHELQDVGATPGLMRAFHLNCKGCHMERRQGPVVCGDCHVRR